MELDELLRRALEAEANKAKKGGLDPDEAIAIAETLEKIARIDLGKVAEERLNSLPAIERMVEELKQGKDVSRALKRKTARKKKTHWRLRRNKKRAYDRGRYWEVLRAQRKSKTAELLSTPEGWFKHQTKLWDRMGVVVRMTEEEFRTEVFPSFYPNHIPLFFRYDSTKPMDLGNLLVKDNDTRSVLFDGKEWLMKKGGWIL